MIFYSLHDNCGNHKSICFTIGELCCIMNTHERNVVMISQRTELLPGVWLNTVQTDRFKTGCFSINFLRPLTLDSAAPNALIPAVLLRGCRSCPDIQSISQRLDTLYGASVGTLIRKKGEVQSVGLYTDFLEDRYTDGQKVFSPMMEFLRELLFEPCIEDGGFLRDFLDGERCNLVNTIDGRMNDKRAYAVSRLLYAMCDGEAYAVPRLGEKETLEPLTGKMLYERWIDLLRTSQVELFYLGQQPADAVAAELRNMLAALPRDTSLEKVTTNVMLPNRPVRYVEEQMDVTQGKLSLGLRTDITVHDPRYPAMLLLNTVFGAGMTSKLFLQIREEQSLCYYANSSMDKFKGIMVVGSGIDFDHYEVARDGIMQQLDLCKKGEITEQEMESARNYLVSVLRTGNDSPGRLDDYAVGQAIAGITGSMEQMIDQILAVTKDQVVEAANTLYLDTVYFLKGVEG